MTGGEYFRAEDAEQLGDVFSGLPQHVETQTEQEEITVWFVLVAALLATAAIGLSLAWNRSLTRRRQRDSDAAEFRHVGLGDIVVVQHDLDAVDDRVFGQDAVPSTDTSPMS